VLPDRCSTARGYHRVAVWNLGQIPAISHAKINQVKHAATGLPNFAPKDIARQFATKKPAMHQHNGLSNW